MSDDEQTRMFRFFEQHGEPEVRRRLQVGISDAWADPYNKHAVQWLALKDGERAEAAASEARAARATDTALASRAAEAAERSAAAAEEAANSARAANSIAAAANRLAREANSTAEAAEGAVALQARAATTANVIAIPTAIGTIVAAIIALAALGLSIWNMTHPAQGGPNGSQAQTAQTHRR